MPRKPNQANTTVMGADNYGNGTGYQDGLNIPLHDPTLETYKGGNMVVSEDKKEFISNIYSSSIDVDQTTSTLAQAPWSLANRYALFTYNGFHGNSLNITRENYEDTIYNPLMGGYNSKQPTIDRIIEFYRDLPVVYEYSDFMWCKWAGYMPNNYMLTLRRFGTPVEDNILSRQKVQAGSGADGQPDYENTEEIVDAKPDMCRAVTWMGKDSGNDLEELLTFTYGYNWKEQSADVNTHEISSDYSYTNHPSYQRGGLLGQSVMDVIGGNVNASTKYSRMNQAGYDYEATTYPNFVIGPVNVINRMMTQDRGLNFEQDIKLKFEYDLKSYGNINPKVALLDIFANLLVLTYSNANFWGGANRFYGGTGYVAPRFGDDSKLRAGDFKGYLSSLVSQIGGGFKSAFAAPDGSWTLESIFSGGMDVMGSFFGNFLGKSINSHMGAPPAAMQLIGMITGEATGNWHLTIGNPLNPIAMIGNLILDSSSIKFKAPLGYDDFPSGIVLECTLKHARPRDKTDFESMFNAGKGRLYASALSEDDFLNLAGKDVRVYGAFQKSDDATGNGTVNRWENTPGEGVVKDETGKYKLDGAAKAFNGALDEAESFINR